MSPMDTKAYLNHHCYIFTFLCMYNVLVYTFTCMCVCIVLVIFVYIFAIIRLLSSYPPLNTEVKTNEELFKPKESSPTALSGRTSSKSPSASGSGFIYGEPVSG